VTAGLVPWHPPLADNCLIPQAFPGLAFTNRKTSTAIAYTLSPATLFWPRWMARGRLRPRPKNLPERLPRTAATVVAIRRRPY